LCNPCYAEHQKDCVAAIKEVRKAIARGDLKPAKGQPCVDCGKDARDLEHRDYTMPLDVVPVCRSCNLKRGTAYDSVYRPPHQFPAPTPILLPPGRGFVGSA
jgi:hypothetical protein